MILALLLLTQEPMTLERLADGIFFSAIVLFVLGLMILKAIGNLRDDLKKTGKVGVEKEK